MGGGGNNGKWTGGTVLLNFEEAGDIGGASCVVFMGGPLRRSLIVGAILGVSQFQCD
jgi:hypothetical protein